MAWEREDTERWLNDYPLPADFVYHGQKVWPRYQLKHGYGQWLRTAGPYHVALRGLFAQVHDLLALIPPGGRMPAPDELAAQLRALDTMQGTLGIEEPPPPPPSATYGQGMNSASLTTNLADRWPKN